MNLTDMDKINIVSSKVVLEMSSFSMDTRSMSPHHWSIALSKIDCSGPHQTWMNCRSMDLSVVDTTLHDSPDLVIHRTEIWAGWRPPIGRKKVWVSWRSSSTCSCTCAAQCASALSNWNTKSLLDTLRIAGRLAAVWRHYDVAKQHRRSQ